jgi:hypothetical protein
MPINNRCCVAVTIAVAALCSATGALANPAYPPDDHAPFHGGGLGAVDTVAAVPDGKGRSSAAFAGLDLRSTWALRSNLDAAELAGNATASGGWALTSDDLLDGGSNAFDLDDAVQTAEHHTVSASQSALAVPEPDTTVLLLAGLAAVGFMVRRQQQR